MAIGGNVAHVVPHAHNLTLCAGRADWNENGKCEKSDFDCRHFDRTFGRSEFAFRLNGRIFLFLNVSISLLLWSYSM